MFTSHHPSRVFLSITHLSPAAKLRDPLTLLWKLLRATYVLRWTESFSCRVLPPPTPYGRGSGMGTEVVWVTPRCSGEGSHGGELD
jgi:hypothetical protein